MDDRELLGNGTVTFEIDGSVAVISMQHPPHNLLGPTLIDDLLIGLKRSEETGCRAILLQSGIKHFSAGAELSLFEGNPTEVVNPEAVIRAFESVTVPIVASVQGAALGGGFELALLCDFIIAASSARIGLVETTLGIAPLMGGVSRVIQRAGIGRGKEIAMLGRQHNPAVLRDWGVINQVVDIEELSATSLSLAKQLAAGPTMAYRAIKKIAEITMNEGVSAADEKTSDILDPLWSSDDLKTGVEAFLQKGLPTANFKGC